MAGRVESAAFITLVSAEAGPGLGAGTCAAHFQGKFSPALAEAMAGKSLFHFPFIILHN